MERKFFLYQIGLMASGSVLFKPLPSFLNDASAANQNTLENLYAAFQHPPAHCQPFVRWWWNGNKIEKQELLRELQLLKSVGIGGVEINPIKFPLRTEDLGKPSLTWLSHEWIRLLDFTLTAAKKLNLTSDLMVGSGWPFGAEYLQGEEQAQIITIGVKKIEGATDFEAPLLDFIKEADPATTSPYAHRQLTVLRVLLVPDPLSSLDQVKDLSEQIPSGFIKVSVPTGKYAIYTLVKTHAFLEVINGVPGATGTVLNHYNKAAVEKYLNHMSATIQQQIGPLKGRVRAMFTDSLELEGANWSADMAAIFKQRKGYDIMPYLPLILFKIGGMGNVFDYNYGVDFTPPFKDTIERIRYDFDLLKTELIRERFIEPFQHWCKANGWKARVQAYGRGYHPLEGSFGMDIPEGETWVKYGVGKEMSEEDYRIGRAYTMANKYVSSAAHLQGKRLISCEEATNTDMVFNTTLQMLKICGDQSIISGITHFVYHGFNYSPAHAPFPGWIRYGNFINEKNTYWPFFKQLADYNGRIAALLQQADMFANIALLPPVYDMWLKYGTQNEPFPSLAHPTYLTFIWEAIHQNGNACDYISDSIIDNATIANGCLQYGTRQYHTLFLVAIESLNLTTAKKLLAFVQSGGTIFCIETIPSKSLGLQNASQKDAALQAVIATLQTYTDKFIFLKKPEKDYYHWYKNIQQQYKLSPYVSIRNGNTFVTQVRYKIDNTEILIFTNGHYEKTFTIRVSPDEKMIEGKTASIWDATTGRRYLLSNEKQFDLTLCPADLRIIVFHPNKKNNHLPLFKPYPTIPTTAAAMGGNWQLTAQHINGSIQKISLPNLIDLKELPNLVHFCGNITYQHPFKVLARDNFSYIDIGLVHGIAQLRINHKVVSVRWYGRYIYDIKNLLQLGDNTIEIVVTTTMGNYMKSLTNNRIAQYWTNEKRKNQPLQSLGLMGPVYVF